MKTQANKTLHFKKGTITELNDKSLLTVNGGTSPIDDGVATRPSTKPDCDVEVRSISIEINGNG